MINFQFKFILIRYILYIYPMKPPQKIISLVPSLTELLFDFGLGDKVIGRTRFCIHPKKAVTDVPVIGGTKNPRVEDILSLEPDLIIANKEENRKTDIEQLEIDTEVMVTDIRTIEEALISIYDIANRVGVPDKARKLIAEIQQEMDHIPDEPALRTAYFIWREPWMTVGNDTYIHSVLSRWNLQNVYEQKTRYPNTTLQELADKAPELIILSSEPYPFKEKHIKEVGSVCPKSNIVLANGEWFSWYGSRMAASFKQLNIFRRAIG